MDYVRIFIISTILVMSMKAICLAKGTGGGDTATGGYYPAVANTEGSPNDSYTPPVQSSVNDGTNSKDDAATSVSTASPSNVQ